MPYVRDEIKRHSQRYTDRMEKHPNVLTKNLAKKLKRQTKRKTSTRSTRLTGAIL